MKFKPCIDLHQGKVKQIVGKSFQQDAEQVQVNFVSNDSSSYFAKMYCQDRLSGGHVIRLGQGNDEAAKSAILSYPNGLQIGGGINAGNAKSWLELGASKVILTSYLVQDGLFHWERLEDLAQLISPESITIDLSCSWIDGAYWVMSNQWQQKTKICLSHESFHSLANYCSEFLIHAIDVEGQNQGIDLRLIELLASFVQKPVVYAGGIRSLADIEKIQTYGQGNIDFTVGSALDIFGGRQLQYKELVRLYG